jgi:predicted HNH restriction endonuclease
MRNPDWVRDEVILAMDLYIGAGRRQLPAAHPDVVALSGILNRLTDLAVVCANCHRMLH